MIVANVTNRPAQGLILAYPTPVSRGYVACIYYVVSIVTTLSLLIAWTDSTGAQTIMPIDAQAQSVGSYVLPPIPFQATLGSVIAVTASATNANDAKISMSIKAI